MADVLASFDMEVDDISEKDLTKRSAILDTPVTDFELSVRARNCLKKMNIRSLGDLLRITESELLGYKNFGETSLHEIKSMLSSRGLRLGQGLDEAHNHVRNAVYEQLRGTPQEHLLSKPVSDLELSVRARKALQMLGVHTIGDLCARTDAELLGVKNFGTTSLVEVLQKLGELNLSLRELGPG
jgi:DNA-directed RNA polymerase subunit alpha